MMASYKNALLIVALLALTAWAGEHPVVPRPPRLVEARVYHYSHGQPYLVKWWTIEDLKIDRELIFPAGPDTFRVRLRLQGQGWVRMAFRDGQMYVHELPEDQGYVSDGVKDFYFRVPKDFAAGPISLSISLRDYRGVEVSRTRHFTLGESKLALQRR